MVSHLFFYQLVLIALVWLCLMLQWAWPSDPAAACPPPRARRRWSPHPHSQNATVSPHPLRASPTSPIVTPVSRIVPLARTPLQPHPRASS